MNNVNTIKCAYWIPQKAKNALAAQEDQKMLLDGEALYLSVLFTDKNLKNFWADVKGYDYSFFARLYMHIYRSHRLFKKKYTEHKQFSDTQDDLTDLAKALTTSTKAIQRLQKNSAINAELFNDVLLQIQDFKDNALHYEMQRIQKNKNKENNNKFRPLSRQSFGEGKQQEANSYAIGLHTFFTKEMLTAAKALKSPKIKEHICSITNSLMDLCDTPLTSRDLDNVLRNFKKKNAVSHDQKIFSVTAK